jgi:hypothetical protein
MQLATGFFFMTLWKSFKVGIVFILTQILTALHYILRSIIWCLKLTTLLCVKSTIWSAKCCPKKSCNPLLKHVLNIEVLDRLDRMLRQKDITIVLDLDNTLIYADKTQPKEGKYTKIKFQPIGMTEQMVYVQKRPFLNEFLELVFCFLI